jgi:hypothetical protein
MSSFNARSHALLFSFWCEYRLMGFIHPYRLRVLPADVALSESTGGEHPTSGPLDAPKIDFLGYHN